MLKYMPKAIQKHARKYYYFLEKKFYLQHYKEDLIIVEFQLMELTKIFLVDRGLVNQSVKIYLKIICSLETKRSKLFESNRQVSTFRTSDPDAKILYYPAPYI